MDDTYDYYFAFFYGLQYTDTREKIRWRSQRNWTACWRENDLLQMLSGRGRKVVAQGDSINVRKTKGNTRDRALFKTAILLYYRLHRVWSAPRCSEFTFYSLEKVVNNYNVQVKRFR